MNKILIVAALIIVGIINSKSQIQPSITYDSLSGDYIIRYQGGQGIIEEYFVPATKINPLISALIVKKTDTLYYYYKVKNHISSRQRLLNFMISVNSSIFNVSRPNTQWHSDPARLIRGWDWGHTLVDPTGAATAYNGIAQDSSVEGFSFLSYGLPSITNCYFQGRAGIMNFEEEPPEEVEKLLKPLQRFPANEVMRKTIAPADPPFPFNSLHFLDTLKSYTTQLRTLGWITNQTTTNKYLAYFDTAKVQIQQNRNWSARFTLDTIVAHVKRDSSGLLSSEAYALIRYNTEYLIDNMPGTIAISSPLIYGWNMVSIPNYIRDFSDSTIYPNMQSSIYTYETSYVKRTTLKNGEGYWIKMDSNLTVTYKGMKIDSIKIPVKNGWNMLGSVSSALHHSKVRTDSTTSLTSNFYGYSRQGYTIDTILQPGKGYWIKVNGTGDLVMNSNYLVSSAYPNSNEQPTARAPGIPDKPVLHLPANGSTNISTTPTLSWHEVHSAETYHLQVSINSNFTCLLINDANITTETKQIGPVYGGTTYYWRVSATNMNGTSYWSNVRSFTTRGKTLFEPCPNVEELSELDQFSVADAEGKRQNLYVRNGGRLISKKLSYAEELPPEQLGEIFSVRYQSGKYIESIPPDKLKRKISIKVKNAKYPLKINWDIKANNNIEYWLKKPVGNPIKLTGKSFIELDESVKGNIQIEAQAVMPGPCEQIER